MSNAITLVFPYYKNKRMLEYQLSIWKEYPANVEIVLVDDGSPIGGRAEEVIPLFDELPPLKLIRIMVDIAWNEGGARNLGVRYASNPWVILNDIDHIIPVETMEKLCAMLLDEQLIYSFTRINHFSRAPLTPHKESRMLTRDMYWKVGGYDESYSGHYSFYCREWRQRLDPIPGQILPIDLERVDGRYIPDANTVGLIRKEGRDTAFWEDVREWKTANNKPIELFKLPWKLVIGKEA